VASEFGLGAVAVGEEMSHWRGDSWLITVASSPATTGRANVSNSGEVNVPRHVAQGRKEAISGEPIQIHCGLLGYGGRSKIVAGVYPRRDIYLPPVLSNCSERESPRR
jgi:hypothetical protein